MTKSSNLFTSMFMPSYIDKSLALLRITFGILMVRHGYGKLVHFSDYAPEFYSLFGIGSEISLALAVFAEVFCSILLCLGLFTRFALIPLIITMLVAFFIIHAADPFGDKEMAFIYLMTYIILFLTGPGKVSLDYKIFGPK